MVSIASALMNRPLLLSLCLLPVLAVMALLLSLPCCTRLFQPCGSGNIPNTEQTEERLRTHVFQLADTIGERNAYKAGTMERSAQYIEQALAGMGYAVTRQAVHIPRSGEYGAVRDRTVYNILATKKGTSPRAKTLIIGAHYDTKVGMDHWHDHGPARPSRTGTPGANDNASGVAALLEVARILAGPPTLHDVCLAAYANEEPPFYQTPAMGSVVHAKSIAARPGKDKVIGMIALETLGCYSPRVNKKRKSAVVAGLAGLPDRCDYVAFLSTNTGKNFARSCADEFAALSRFPVRSVAFPYYMKGVSWSDDWGYMKEGIPSFAATDTAFLRCDDYHETSDTAEKLDYPQFAEVVQGLSRLIISTASKP